MKNKLFAVVLALTLLLPGCSLAREDEEMNTVRFMGVYIVQEEPGVVPDRSHWTEYGSREVETDWGKIDIPQEILIGIYDEDTHNYTFPGLEGKSLFVYQGQGKEGNPYIASANDLCDGSFDVTATDGGENYELSGTYYLGPPINDPDCDPYEDQRVTRFYNVYRMTDGTIFLDGSGDGFVGGAMSSVAQTETVTATTNGESVEVYTKVEIYFQFVERLESLVVRQYSAAGDLLCSEEIDTAGEMTVHWHPDAAWALVEENRGGQVKRTAYDRPGDGDKLDHTVVLLDEDGLGYGRTLRLTEP